MDFILNLDINIFALLLLFLLFINANRNSDTHSYHTKLFLLMVLVNGILLAMDSVLQFANGKQGLVYFNLNIFLNMLYFMTAPIAGIFWLKYVDYHIFSDEDRLKKYRLKYYIPIILNSIIVASSFFTGLIFYIDSNNVYHQGQFYYFVYLITFLTFLYTWFFSYNNRKLIDSRDIVALQIFIFPITLGIIIQIMNPSISSTWPSMSLSILIVFISVEMRKIYGDYLTGAHSRRQLDEYIKYRIKLAKKIKGFTIAMIDMDDFKYINDKYGHHEGDQALINFVKLVKKSIRGNDFIARFAGDEFVIVFDFEDDNILAFVLNRIYENIKDFNEQNLDSYNIKFSIGLETIKYKEIYDFDELFRIIDRKMYEQKESKKRL